MHPFERDPVELPQGVLLQLDVRLKSGWRFDSRRRTLVSEAGQEVGLRKLLPPGTKVVPMVPSLANADPKELSEDERFLARCLQMLFPRGTDLGEICDVLRKPEAVDHVSIPPRMSLP